MADKYLYHMLKPLERVGRLCHGAYCLYGEYIYGSYVQERIDEEVAELVCQHVL